MTRLFTPLRQFLTWDDGSAVVNLDLKNSQVVCLVKQIQEYHWGQNKDLPADVQDFIAATEAGRIYDDLFATAKEQFPEYLKGRKERAARKKAYQQELMLYIGNRVRPADLAAWKAGRRRFAKIRKLADIQVCVGEVTRSDFKLMIFADLLFGKPEIDNPITRIFAQRFPSVVAFIRQQKRGDYCRLAHDLQRIESGIMIDTVCERLRVYHPEVPVATIHDSNLTDPSHTELVCRIIKEEYAKLGLRPTLKIGE